MNNNLVEINHSAEAAKRLRQKITAWNAATETWIVATLELAAELQVARQMHQSNQAFGLWLAENELDDLSKNNRAALLKMGSYRLLRAVLEETTLRSPELIWRYEIQPRLIAAGSSYDGSEDDPPKTISMEIEKPALPAVESSQEPDKGEPKAHGDTLAPAHVERLKAPVSDKSPFRKWPRADELTAIFQNPNTRSVIGKAINQSRKGGNDLWKLLLYALDADLLKPTDTSFQSATLNLRVLFPQGSRAYCNQFDLTKAQDRAKIREVVLPALIDSRDAFLQDPSQLEILVAAYVRRHESELLAKQAAARLARQVSAMPAHEEQIVMYGEQLWPRPDNELYGYKEVRSAIWAFLDLDLWIDKTRDASPASRALMMRHIVGNFHSFARHELEGAARAKIENVMGVISKLSRLMERNPQGECKFPSPPHSEDEW
jgi:hypothetical protein